MTNRVEAMRLRHLLTRRTQRGEPDGELLSVYREHGVVRKNDRKDNFNKPGEDLASYLVVMTGDLVLNKMKTWQGSLGVSAYDGIVSPAYFVCAIHSRFDGRFVHHLLRSRPLIAEYASRSQGIRPNQWDLPWNQFVDIKVGVPFLEKQRIVASFLDRECARVDELSAGLSSFARSLRDGRQEMAARELRNLPTVPLRYRLRSIDQGWSPECENAPANAGEWGVLKVGCVNYGRFRASEHKRLPSSLEPRRAAEAKVGDLLVSRANTRELVGSAAVVDDLTDRRLMLSDKLYRLRTTADLVPEFAALALNSRDVRWQVEADTSGASSSMQNISQDLVRRLRMPACSVTDQLTILARYGEMSGRVDAAVKECDATRHTLAEYRDALITEAVTGQLDVTTMSESRMQESLAAVREGEAPEVLAR